MPMHSLTMPFRGLQWVTDDASVSPYPSTSRPPVAASNCLRTSFGRGAAPEMQARIDRRSYFASFGCRRIAMYIVGTPGNRLGFVLLISLRIAPISRGFGWRITSIPATTDKSITAVSPYTWNRGIAPSNFSDRCEPAENHAPTFIALAMRLRLVSIAPFDVPVVPPVY